MFLLSTSLSLQRNAQTASNILESSLERLSSGLRIVRAADDPAGMAVAASLRSRLGSRQAAIRNIEDALTATGVADGGLEDIADLLIRLRQLAVQAASETLDNDSRSYLNYESKQILDQVEATAQNAIYADASTLSYPGVDVGLVIDTSGSMYGEILRVKESITDFQQMFVTARYNVQLGLAEYRNTADSGDNTIRQTDIGSSTLLEDLDALTVAGGSVDPYAALTEVTGITQIDGQTDPDAFSFRPGAVKVLILITDSLRQADFISGSETQADVAGWLADEGIQVHVITPPSVSGDYSTIASTTDGAVYDIGNSGGSNIPTAMDDIAASVIAQLEQSDPLTFHIGIDSTDSISTPFPLDMTLVGLGLTTLDLTTVADASTAIDTIDTAIDEVSQAQSMVGGLHQRLESAMSTQLTSQEAESSTLSTIQDLDFARESATMTAAQLRLTTSIAAMAQAREIDEDVARRLLAE